MGRRRVFWIGSWAALVAAVVVGAAAVAVAVIGGLALAGKMTYPVEYELGPVSFRVAVSMPVAIHADVCQTGDVRTQAEPRDCFRFFVHHQDLPENPGPIRHQDADVRPTTATLTGEVALTTRGGWSPLVAASVAHDTIGLVLISGGLFMLWRFLATVAAGDVFSSRAVWWLRSIGWIVIAGGVVVPVLGLFTGTLQLGYGMETFGEGPNLEPWNDTRFDLGQIALGGLVLLVAEVLRYGATLEAERRLTV